MQAPSLCERPFLGLTDKLRHVFLRWRYQPLVRAATNNLDLPGVEEVIAMLNAYRGALVVVSHDAWFLDRVGVNRTICLDP